MKLLYEGEALVKQLRKQLEPDASLSKQLQAGRVLLSRLSDRDLWTLFGQLHIRKIDLQKSVDFVCKILKLEKPAYIECVRQAIPEFGKHTKEIVVENNENDLDWQNANPIDEMQTIDGLAQHLKWMMLQMHAEMKGAPVITRVQETVKLAEVLGKTLERRADIAIKTGDRAHPEIPINHKMDQAFQRLLLLLPEEDREAVEEIAAGMAKDLVAYAGPDSLPAE